MWKETTIGVLLGLGLVAAATSFADIRTNEPMELPKTTVLVEAEDVLVQRGLTLRSLISPAGALWTMDTDLRPTPLADGLLCLDGAGLGALAVPGERLRPGVYLNTGLDSVILTGTGGEDTMLLPGDMLAYGVEVAGGSISVSCDENHFACCSSRGWRVDGTLKWATCRKAHEGDGDCETGGKGSTGCSVVPRRSIFIGADI